MDEPWIKLHFKLQDSEVWKSEKFTKGQAWVDMLLMAKHEDNMFLLRGNEVHVKWGQFAKSENLLAKKWGWSREKVRRFQEWLKTRQQITVNKSHIISIVTITNYPKYQQNGTTNKTTEKQQKNNRKPPKSINKNGKKDKPIKDKYLDYVFLTQEEHKRLIKTFGEKTLKALIWELDNYIGAKPAKRNDYTDHNRVLQGWVKDKVLGNKAEVAPQQLPIPKIDPGEQALAIKQTRARQARLAKVTKNIGKEMP